MDRKKLIPILAAVVIIIGIGASLFVFLGSSDTSTVRINGTEYRAKELLAMAPEVKIEEYSGAALDELMIAAGVTDPETHEYLVVSVDGYQKTVTWENMQNGLITAERMSIFSDLPKAFRVKDIIEIKAE